jgi:D-beta-D-heptose 7-phosphate kinase/D-beta-D-heptose 1-phosphate adenosyltransferase
MGVKTKKINKLQEGRSLRKKVVDLKKQGKKVVLSSGSWDMLHVGHMRYLKEASKKGDFLVVGVDSDKKIQKRKGPNRPVVPEEERLEMLSHLEYVDALYLKKHTEKEGNLIKLIEPNVLIVSESTKHDPKHLALIQKYCGEICVLPPQAETSTTARIRKLHIGGKQELVDRILAEMPSFVAKFLETK